VISNGAFNKTLSDRGLDFRVLFNHGKTFDGRTDGYLQMPVGIPRLVEAHDRGLYSETEYLENPLADATLEAIKKGALKGYSFTGRFVKSSRQRGGTGILPTITRSEVDMREYGPVLYPAYPTADIVGTRMTEILASLDSHDIDRFREILGVPSDVSITLDDSGADLGEDEPAERHSVLAANSIRLARMERGM
jgi:HK97 family phage prohead protease